MGADHLSELAGQTGQFFNRRHVFEDPFLHVYENDTCYLRMDRSGRPALTNNTETL